MEHLNLAQPDQLPSIARRKSDHLTINLHEDVSSNLTTGFEHYHFAHRALPEIDLQAIDTSTMFLGKRLAAPFLISSMTGGIERGGEINRRLAQAAQAVGCAMGVGSQRAALEFPEYAATFRIRDVAPDIPLFANLGAVQLNYGIGIDDVRRALDMISADALILHLNPLQEALQPDGNHDFGNLLVRITDLTNRLECPVIVKEVGFGIGATDARRLADAGVAAIDIAGAGGTSWSRVEQLRASNDRYRRLGDTFRSWGLPTALSLRMVREAVPKFPVIASGGLRTGLDAATAIALGANLAAFAGPLLRAAAESDRAVCDTLETLVMELRFTMFASGSATIEALGHAPLFADDAGWVEVPSRATDHRLQGQQSGTSKGRADR